MKTVGNQHKKEKALQTRFGFVDEDLKTPAHDALMFWIDEYISEILVGVFDLTEAPKILVKRWEFVLTDRRQIRMGAADMYVLADRGKQGYPVFIEAKPKIRSLGELIRQINFYKSGSDFMVQNYGEYTSPNWLVVSPDDHFADKLKEQGILFHKSPPTQ